MQKQKGIHRFSIFYCGCNQSNFSTFNATNIDNNLEKQIFDEEVKAKAKVKAKVKAEVKAKVKILKIKAKLLDLDSQP